MTFPQSFRRAIARIVLEEIPAISIRGHHTFRVDVVRGDGRVDLVSTTDAFEPISSVDHWCGVAGAAALPVVGSTVTVVFLDDDVKQPALVSYQPLRATGGKPTQSSIDATTLKLGPTATLVELGGSGAAALALAAQTTTNFTTLKTAITNTIVVPNDGGASFKSTLIAALTTWPSALATTKVKGA